ncbi:hypothetical protein HanRHA438_Chr08g0371911 [Helianthus annuus]|nr:hypothetical protein HanIR_Chr08g0388501 [Helianthus annuus]KAJ0899725.1 hypothetical protein HanRHA438_Chr08g0371911 [Helianthus annuus]
MFSNYMCFRKLIWIWRALQSFKMCLQEVMSSCFEGFELFILSVIRYIIKALFYLCLLSKSVMELKTFGWLYVKLEVFGWY